MEETAESLEAFPTPGIPSHEGYGSTPTIPDCTAKAGRRGQKEDVHEALGWLEVSRRRERLPSVSWGRRMVSSSSSFTQTYLHAPQGDLVLTIQAVSVIYQHTR